MKILHTSDWHLGASDGNRSLIKDQRFFVDEIYRVIEEENVDVVVIAGDVFDRSVTDAETIRLYDDVMTHLCIDLKKQVIIVAGNHDSAERLSSCNTLLSRAGLHIQGSISAEPAIVEIDDVDFYMLPWFSEDKVKSVYPDQKDDIHDITDAYMVVCNKCRETFKAGKKHIAVSHAFITGAELSKSDRAAELAVVGLATQVSRDVFDGFDYVALGHIHKPQDVSDKIRYSGTPMPFSFGREETQEKSVTIIDTDTMVHKIVPLKLLHKRVSLVDTWSNISSKNYPEDIIDGYVKIEVTDEVIGTERSAIIYGKFHNVFELTGKTNNDVDVTTSMTMNEFRELESDPVMIFKRFYRDTKGNEASEHFISLFQEAIGEIDDDANKLM